MLATPSRRNSSRTDARRRAARSHCGQPSASPRFRAGQRDGAAGTAPSRQFRRQAHGNAGTVTLSNGWYTLRGGDAAYLTAGSIVHAVHGVPTTEAVTASRCRLYLLGQRSLLASG